MASLISEKFPQGEPEVARKMAMLPRGSVLGLGLGLRLGLGVGSRV